MTSPSKSKGQPKLKSFHEEKSPKMRMINGQSTESLESLSDELASNSGGSVPRVTTAALRTKLEASSSLAATAAACAASTSAAGRGG